MAYLGNAPTSVPLSSADILDSAITSAKIANGTITGTDISSTFDLTGKTVTLPAGTGGKVLQVVQTVVTTAFSTSSGSLVDITGLTASITPNSTSNKVLIITHIYTGNGGTNGYPRFSLFRGATQINLGASAGSATRESMTLGVDVAGGQMATVSSCFLDSPSTTSSTTYKWQTSVYESRTQYFNVPSSTGDTNAHTAGSTITLMEIAG